MKTLLSLFFASAMILSAVFVSETISTNNPFAAQAQVKVVRRSRNAAVRGSKYVYRKAKAGGYYVYRGGKYVGKASYRGGKYVAGKSVQGTKYVGKKTVKGSKSVYSKTKKVVTGN